MKVAHYTAMLHVAFLKRGPGVLGLTGAKAGRSRLLRGTLCAARLSLRRAAYSRPHIISLVLQAGTTATIFMSSGLTITTSSS